MANILLIDDNDEVGVLVGEGMKGEHQVEQVYTLSQAENALSLKTYDLLLIDALLPDGNGMDLCGKLVESQKYLDTPKILLTALDQVADKEYAFAHGADDYLTKPFQGRELRARVDRYLRRSKSPEKKVFLKAGFEFDLDFQVCYSVQGEERQNLNLTPTEFRLLLLLCRSENKVLTRPELEKLIWQAYGTNIESRGIDTHVAHLRKKIGSAKNCIVSVYGRGYSFRAA
ncbi:MAG: response regulator transcription factor [Bdellovibrionales bacterium]